MPFFGTIISPHHFLNHLALNMKGTWDVIALKKFSPTRC